MCWKCDMLRSGASAKDVKKEQARWEREMMGRYGFWVEAIPQKNGLIEVHTHGLATSFAGQRYDLMLRNVEADAYESAHDFIHDLVDQCLRRGNSIRAGFTVMCYEGSFIATARESKDSGGRRVLWLELEDLADHDTVAA